MDCRYDFAIFGAEPLFSEVKPTSNLYQPDIERVLDYSRIFYKNKRYTNDGELARLLERRLADFHGVGYAVAVTGAFWGLVLAIKALAIPGKTEVIIPSLTYRRMDDIVSWANLTPHFCDVERSTLAVTPETIEASITDNTALILAVHPIVNSADAGAIEALGKRRRIPVLFDSVESAFETVNGRRIGGFGDAEVFSIHASKFINGFEGGYITTRHKWLAEKLATTKRFGFVQEDSVEFGESLNAKLNEMHAAMALASLDEVSIQVAQNKVRYEAYRSGLKEITGLRCVEYNPHEMNDYKSIVVELTEEWPLSREDTMRVLHADGILVRPYYSPPLHHKEVVYERIIPSLPVTDAVFKRYMLLPSGAHVSIPDIEEILRFMARMRGCGSVLVARMARELA